MAGDDIYTFDIDAYTPETIPMGRLAEYMVVLARMFGERDNVHFAGLQQGSTRLVSRVQREAAPKVRDNLLAAAAGEGRPDAAKAFRTANDMLRKDNASALLLLEETSVLAFPGKRQLRPEKLGPFTQGIEKDGVLVRIGGVDRSAHATIEDSAGVTWSFEVARELAVELAHHLFATPIRLLGTGRFFRDEDGAWQHTSLRAHAFQTLQASDLADTVRRIRSATADAWRTHDDPMAMLRSLRDGEPH